MHEKLPIGTFNISFEITQNKQQHGTKITCIEVRGEVMMIRNVMKKIGTFQVPDLQHCGHVLYLGSFTVPEILQDQHEEARKLQPVSCTS